MKSLNPKICSKETIVKLKAVLANVVKKERDLNVF
jgi:hypothetical protein